MSSLPYSIASFSRLAEREARKDKDPTKVDPAVRRQMKALTELRSTYLSECKKVPLAVDAHRIRRQNYTEQRALLRIKRDDAITNALSLALTNFESAFSTDTFTWHITKGPKLGTRQTYRIPNSLARQLPAKQAEVVLRQAAHLSPLSRNSIVGALQEALKKPYMHALIKLDLSKYFDSIPHDRLIQKLRDTGTLDRVTFRLVNQLLGEFAAIAGSNRGVPQGVGLSSQLAEFYLANFDKKIRSHPGVLFYARYVDDVVVILETKSAMQDVGKEIDQQLLLLGLDENKAKGRRATTNHVGVPFRDKTLEYLGYEFDLAAPELRTNLTTRRIERIKLRIDLAFQNWVDANPTPLTPNTGNDGLLVDRLRYLASNTKLQHSKSNVAVGIFFSNSALDTDSPQLRHLDAHVQSHIGANAALMSPDLERKVRSISLETGFIKRTFIRFNQQRLQRIVSCWKDAS